MKSVLSKGVLWGVTPDGAISVPARVNEYRTAAGKVHQMCFSGGLIRPHVGAHGYLQVDTRFQGKKVRELVHRLIALAYVPGFSPEKTVNHIDGNKTNNAVSNLEWITRAENTAHQWAVGLVNLRGEKHPGAKLSDADVIEVRRSLAAGESVAKVATRFKVSTALIYKIRQGKKRIM